MRAYHILVHCVNQRLLIVVYGVRLIGPTLLLQVMTTIRTHIRNWIAAIIIVCIVNWMKALSLMQVLVIYFAVHSYFVLFLLL